jgi:transposase-like protein
MSKTRHRYDDEFKKNAVKLSYASNKTVKEIAGDLGIILLPGSETLIGKKIS